MKSEKLLFLFILILASCASQNIMSDKRINSSENQFETKNEEVGTIYNNKLVLDWSEHILLSLKGKHSYSIYDTIVSNLHYPDQKDTVRTFEKSNSNIKIYITPEKNILLDSDLYEKSIRFSKNIEIGDNRENIANELGVNFSNDTLKIMEEDGYGIYFLLFFNDNILGGIHYSSVLD